jgi:transcriptional regulator with XRE-family HTH domain
MNSFVETFKTKNIMNNIGGKIKELRKKKGFSQEELAESSKVNLRTIQRIESNQSEPRGKTLHMICEVLGVNVEDILDYGKQEDQSYLVYFHLSALTFLVIPLGNIIIPMILWQSKKDKIIGLKEVGANLLNFQIIWSVLTYISATIFATFKIMHYGGFDLIYYLFVGLCLLNIVLPIAFAIQAKQGKTKRYPRLIRLVG